MKTYRSGFIVLFSLLFLSELAVAQQQQGQSFGNIFMVHKEQLAFPKDGSDEELDAMIKEYNEKVISKNEFIVSQRILRHWYGHDNRDFITVTEVKSWDDVPKVNQRNVELFNESWKNGKEREDYWNKYEKYFTGVHSDEIYNEILNGTKENSMVVGKK